MRINYTRMKEHANKAGKPMRYLTPDQSDTVAFIDAQINDKYVAQIITPAAKTERLIWGCDLAEMKRRLREAGCKSPNDLDWARLGFLIKKAKLQGTKRTTLIVTRQESVLSVREGRMRDRAISQWCDR